LPLALAAWVWGLTFATLMPLRWRLTALFPSSARLPGVHL